jgi:2-polyprenyl-3-methyl-5-hydroxy-6-metoxy-1,4-benzoquinol methylase
MPAPLATRVSAAAHTALPHANPLSVRQVSDLIGFIAHAKPATALDVGCGPGALAIALATKCSAKVLGIDISEPFLERAKLASASLAMSGEPHFISASPLSLSNETFDAILCVGSSQAIGTPIEALAWCRDRLSPEGLLLFAELTWRRRPEPRFIEFLGVAESLYWSEEHEARVFADAGLRILQVERASPQAWKAYEDAVFEGRQRFAAQLDPEEGGIVLAHANAWKTAFDNYGANCLDFTAYVATQVDA